MPAHCLQRWAGIEPALVHCPMFAGVGFYESLIRLSMTHVEGSMFYDTLDASCVTLNLSCILILSRLPLRFGIFQESACILLISHQERNK